MGEESLNGYEYEYDDLVLALLSGLLVGIIFFTHHIHWERGRQSSGVTQELPDTGTRCPMSRNREMLVWSPKT